VAATALVVGGTGPTGPHVLEGLLKRGFDVTIFHRGSHEPDDLPEVRHVHGDPHFAEAIQQALGDRAYDVVVAAYGRIRLLAEFFAGRTGHFLTIGGTPRYAGYNTGGPANPQGLSQPVREGAPLATTIESDLPSIAFAQQIVRTEQKIFAAQPDATHIVYPVVYGPRNVWPWEWSIVNRARDGRRRVIVTDDGLELHTRGAARNLAEILLCAIDRPAVARGQVYNAGDDDQFNVHQWVEMAVDAIGADIEIVSVPSQLAPILRGAFVPSAQSIYGQALLDTSKVREQLGYRDVISPRDALRESLEWYQTHPIVDLTAFPAFCDPFNYDLEDWLIEHWAAFREEVATRGDLSLPAQVHPMPHPKQVGQPLDEKAR
jgi:nucleoside-diphosphate-sugar epimerase